MIHLRFIRDLVRDGTLTRHYVRSSRELEDCLTKYINKRAFNSSVSMNQCLADRQNAAVNNADQDIGRFTFLVRQEPCNFSGIFFDFREVRQYDCRSQVLQDMTAGRANITQRSTLSSSGDETGLHNVLWTTSPNGLTGDE